MSDLEKITLIVGSLPFEREESDCNDLTRRPDSQSCENSAERNSYSNSNSRENEIKGLAGNGHSTSEIGSNNNFNRLTGEIYQRLTQEMNGLMDSFNLEIQRAMNVAINEQVFSSIQASFRALNEQTTEREGNARRERSERISKNAFRHNIRFSNRDERLFDPNFSEDHEDSHY